MSNEYGRGTCEDGRPVTVSDCLLHKPVVIDRDSFIARGWSQLNVDFVESITRFLPAREIIYLHRTCHAWLRIADHIRAPHLSKSHDAVSIIIPRISRSLIRRHIAALDCTRTPVTQTQLESIIHHLPKLLKLTCWVHCTDDSTYIFPPQLKELGLTFQHVQPFSSSESEKQVHPDYPNWVNACLNQVSQISSLTKLTIGIQRFSDQSLQDRTLSAIHLQPFTRLVDSLTHLNLNIPVTKDRIPILRQLINLVSLKLSAAIAHAELSGLFAEPLPFRLQEFSTFDSRYSNEDVPLLARLSSLTSFTVEDGSDLTDFSFLPHMTQLRHLQIVVQKSRENPENVFESLSANPFQLLTSLTWSSGRDVTDQDITRILSRPMPVLKKLHLSSSNILSLAFLRQFSSTLESFTLIANNSISHIQLVHLRYFPRLTYCDLSKCFSDIRPLDQFTRALIQPDSQYFERAWFPALTTFKFR